MSIKTPTPSFLRQVPMLITRYLVKHLTKGLR